MEERFFGELTQLIDGRLSRPCHLLMRTDIGDEVESFHRIRSDRRIYTAITTELWEQYVHPPMHECQWELIQDMVASF